MQPVGAGEAALQDRVREALREDLLAADLKCSFFVSALQSYKRDSVLRPFPGLYATQESKDFDALLADTNVLGGLKELLESSQPPDKRAWELVDWILSSKALSIHSTSKDEYKKIQELTGAPSVPVATPDFLFEITYCPQMNSKFEETRMGRDLIYAFHGSRLENFHSIIHNGLQCHLNRTSLFGEGTYLTSDLSLALLYSPHGLGWHQSVMGPILSCVAVCEIIDHPDVKCQVKKKDSKEIDKKRARIRHSEGGDVPQKYFVVTNNQLIRVKYLLLYSQKQHRRPASQSWVSKHRFAVTMCLYLLLLVVIGASNSPAFLYYWNRIFDFKR
ncbi:protein mono-ADP-ribosyltransferase PARP16 [Hemicordylus capensis]|uniref:protein mono-ADP-ribosyltransferase PARP16 n=1 Tax=Hemicordylus capensis TaxID=884348 RepID=UPI00230471ED|nr:protein mono-ADP-ribosyltransferase PARP16 [Hemicordylus capensis]XP_053128869.1 protein mono-ADP-ribosyltransferase PARP16 [Hemicordylus capensis]XP_053128870.1 protein mono-ADP-ribosyltransferase PARP16 [Hemicordylus capensis]XP_053128871.1 protein mono-ADP-ribosyltransferase PARP16 [Hemicordylus capensis]XP_053128872.1 protein mono-ADP-ribosyltransferase PARP16 [Hemicordylus capensis]XP_053128873.1 protein mono-ADP-ribosyltransferase PARP16 [Hemicordylus capensis]XP_053128874.1 protein 